MAKVDLYRAQLRSTPRGDWEALLLRQSGLPGPRGNIELGRAEAEEGDEEMFLSFLSHDAASAPANDPREFLVFCGVLGLGRLLAEGRHDCLPVLRTCASDPRWRVREAVAMALQRWGAVDMEALLREMEAWASGNLLERRAAVAALCEPVLLASPAVVARVLTILDTVTQSLAGERDRRGNAFRTLRQGLGYGWSVAVAAWPEGGRQCFERTLNTDDPDLRWLLRENLKKARLLRLDPQWVQACLARLAEGSR